MSREAAIPSLHVSGCQSHAAAQNPPIRRLGGHQGKKGFEKSSFATAGIAFRAILSHLHPTLVCLGSGTRVLQALVGGVLPLVIRGGMMPYAGSSGSSGSRSSMSSRLLAAVEAAVQVAGAVAVAVAVFRTLRCRQGHARTVRVVHKERDLRPVAGSFVDASTNRILSPSRPLPNKATACSFLSD